jgi:hypothetical protein
VLNLHLRKIECWSDFSPDLRLEGSTWIIERAFFFRETPKEGIAGDDAKQNSGP